MREKNRFDILPGRPRAALMRSMDLQTTIAIMSEKHSPTKKLLELCVQCDHMLLLHLDDMNMRGHQVWAAYYGYCDGLFEKFRVLVTQRDLDLVNYVNMGPWTHRAVPRGGAPRGSVNEF